MSNFHIGLGLEEKMKSETKKCFSKYIIEGNQFELAGYKIVSWNTKVDGSGQVYVVDEIFNLETNLILYVECEEKEMVVISYGDINLNGEIDEGDYLLLEENIFQISQLSEQALLNADVNNDKKTDMIDVDIIKQAYLGTEGYEGSLSNNSILIYELYEGTLEDSGNKENTSDNSSNSGTGGTGNGSVSGSSGSGIGGNTVSSGGVSGSGSGRGNKSNSGESSSNAVSK